jgi:signal transduction histidine kinase
LVANGDITLGAALTATPMHILLIEDNLAEARFLQEILKGRSLSRFRVSHVQRLRDAMQQLGQQSFDVILLDLTLPDSQGLPSLDELLRQYGKMPIVVLTNTNDEDLALEAVRRGAQDYLVKRQVNQDILVRSLSYAIERKQAAEALKEINETLELRVQERTAELALINDRLIQEIAERKRLEAQFLRAQRLESLGTLATGIAHDLNNILTPILAIVQLLPLKFTNLDEHTQHLLHIIEDSAHRGADLVQQILSFARGVEGKRAAVPIPILIQEVTQILRQTLPKTIAIQVTIAEGIGVVYGDATQLHQVLMNLCVNARDAMPNGGLLQISVNAQTLDDQAQQIHLDAIAGEYIVISIQDNGLGMSSSILDRIFDPFFTTKTVGQGTGLGLSAVLGIVKSHAGFVDVESEVTQGSLFRVFLPIYQAATCALEQDFDLLAGEQELVLIVDDEASIREIAKATLETYNYRVLTASDGMEAIALYSEYQSEIEIVLMDLMMPIMDGFSTISSLRQFEPCLAAIAMSGLSSMEMVNQAERMGFQGFLQKPFSAKDLLQALHER